MNNIIKTVFRITLVLVLFSVVGCKDDDNFLEVTIESVSPNPVYPFETVTMQGSNFDLIQFVFVGNRQVEFQLYDDTLTFVVPDSNLVPAGVTTVTLAMVGGYRVTTEIEILVLPIPQIRAISPTAAAPGSEVTIAGTSLDNDTSVTIGGMAATISSNNGSEMVVVVPAGLSNYEAAEIEITTSFGSTSSDDVGALFFAGPNLLLNGELEMGGGDDFDNWGKWNGGTLMTATTNSNEAYFGRTLKAAPEAGNPWNIQFVSDPVPTAIGSDYTVVMWAKSDGNGVMRFSTNPDALYGPDNEIGANWTQIIWTFTANTANTRVVLDMGAGSSTLFIDNITLIEGSGATVGPSELLVNGSFEDDLNNWESLNGTHTVSTSEFYCGSASLTATGAGANPWDTQIASDPLALEAGTEYEISFWAKAAGPDGVFRISMSQYDGNGSDFFYSDDLSIPEDWTYFSFVVEAQTVASGVYRLLFDMGATAQTFFVDNVTVKEYVMPTGINENGGFEEDLDTWESLNGVHAISTSEFHSGSASMTATGAGSNPWNTQIASSSLDMVAGTDYKISFWAKAAGPDGVFRISMSQYDGNGSDFFYSDDLSIPEDWTYFSFVVEAQTVASGVYRLLFDMGATAQTFFLDDVSVVEYDGCD